MSVPPAVHEPKMRRNESPNMGGLNFHGIHGPACSCVDVFAVEMVPNTGNDRPCWTSLTASEPVPAVTDILDRSRTNTNRP